MTSLEPDQTFAHLIDVYRIMNQSLSVKYPVNNISHKQNSFTFISEFISASNEMLVNYISRNIVICVPNNEIRYKINIVNQIQLVVYTKLKFDLVVRTRLQKLHALLSAQLVVNEINQTVIQRLQPRKKITFNNMLQLKI